MAKKKISSQDFLNLLDDQDTTPPQKIFRVEKKKPKQKAKPRLKFGKFQLSPVQDELVRLVFSKTPLVSKLGAPGDLQNLIDRIGATAEDVKSNLRQLISRQK